MPVVNRLTERNLEAVFSQTPYLLVRVDRFPTATFQQGLVEYFDHRFPRLITYVIVARNEFSPTRLNELFQSSVGPLRAGVKDGYYLFEARLVVGYHMGQLRSTSVSYGTAEENAQRERLRQSPIGAMRLPEPTFEALCHLAAYFEPIVVRKQRASGFGEDGTAAGFSSGYVYETPPGAQDRAPGSAGPSSSGSQPRENDPYQVLGITSAATDDEVKSAYRNQVKLNHPDKVAHLSPALQAFAQQQTLVVNQAYEAILSIRGRKR